jgi:hypothetical protein
MRVSRIVLALTLAVVPAAAILADDSDKKQEPAKDDEGKLLEKKLHVPSGWNAEKHTVDLTYDFANRNQKKDWKCDGFDHVTWADEEKEGTAGLQLAVGNGVKGLAVLDVVEFAGDYTIEITGKQNYKQSGAQVVFLFGAKGGDSFGGLYADQFIKLKKGGNISAVTKNDPSEEQFNNGREVKVKYVRTGDELEVTLNGDTKGKHKFGKKELDGKAGIFIAQQCRFLATNFHVTGVIAKVK